MTQTNVFLLNFYNKEFKIPDEAIKSTKLFSHKTKGVTAKDVKTSCVSSSISIPNLYTLLTFFENSVILWLKTILQAKKLQSV